MSDEFELLVLGGGPAGLSAARAYRAAGGPGAVGIVTDEHRVPYNRPPLTKELLRGESSEDELPIEEESWLDEHDVDLVSGRAVTLDPEARTVGLSGGRELGYRTCVLATGAEPTRLPVPGADHPAVRVIRTLDHVRELTSRLRPGDAVVVIGSGFIGCEIAASLRRRGHSVTLIADEQQPNAARLGLEAAEHIHRWLDEEGVNVHLGTAVEEIARRNGAFEVLAGPVRARAAIVVMAAGVAPRGELAAAAGIELRDGALPASSAMRTAKDGLYTAGDVAFAVNARAARPLRIEHWGDALGQGEVAGRNAAGERVEWEAVPGFWSTIGNRTLKYAAWGDGFDQARLERHRAGAFTAWYGREGKLVGVLAHDADEDYERGRSLIAAGASWRLAGIVVIPARDEERSIAACLAALAAQTVPREAFETILVLDVCADGTAHVAERSAATLGLPLTLVQGPGRGAGAARRTGMDLAAARLLALGLEDGLIACTDADSRPDRRWLECQLRHVRAGGQAIAGLIELDPEESERLPPNVLRRRERDAAQRLGRIRSADPTAAHHHFAGASMAVTAGVYRDVGGLEPVVGLEDAVFAARLRRARHLDPARHRRPRPHLGALRRPGLAGAGRRPGRLRLVRAAPLRRRRLPARAAAPRQARARRWRW